MTIGSNPDSRVAVGREVRHGIFQSQIRQKAQTRKAGYAFWESVSAWMASASDVMSVYKLGRDGVVGLVEVLPNDIAKEGSATAMMRTSRFQS